MDKLSQEVGLIVIASAFFLLVAVGIIALVMVYRRKQSEMVHEQAAMKAAFEKEILESELRMQEQTMKHIAQEIHDNIGGTLTLAKLNLNTISPTQLRQAVEKIGNTTELVTKAISDLRTLSKTLHPDAVLSIGLVTAIEMELSLLQKAAGMQTKLSVNGTAFEVDRQKELIIFRTVQEALNNAIKHSDASVIEISVAYDTNELVISIYDNGKGFDCVAVNKDPAKGLGLRNMQNRAKMIGGHLTIDGSLGTKIQISLPIIAA